MALVELPATGAELGKRSKETTDFHGKEHGFTRKLTGGFKIIVERPSGDGLLRTAYRKLAMLDSAESIRDLIVPPDNRLEKLSGNRKGQHSIRINDQWRICFVWKDEAAFEVEITDYHA